MDHLPSPFVNGLFSDWLPRWFLSFGPTKVVSKHQWCTDVHRFLKRKNSFNLWSSTIWAEQTSLKPPPLGKICFRTIWGTKMWQKHRLSPYIWEDMLEEPPLDYIGITHPQSKCRKLLLAKLPSSSASGASTRNHSNVEKHNQFKSTCGPNFTKKQHKTHTFPNKKKRPAQNDRSPPWN